MKTEPGFLCVKCGDFVLISSSPFCSDDWWVGQVVCCVGSSGSPFINSLFQVIDIDTGVIKIISAGFVRGIIKEIDLISTKT